MMKFLTVAFLGCALVACTSQSQVVPGQTVVNLPANLASLTVADLQAADVDAKAHGDAVASMCYEAVIPMIQVANSPVAPVGAVSAFQDLRDGVATSSGAQALLKQLEVPCGPLAVDVNLSLVDLIAKFAVAVKAV